MTAALRRSMIVVLSMGPLTLATACVVDEVCTTDRDCPDQQICDPTTGSCAYECEQDEDCGSIGFVCVDHECQFECEGDELSCAEGMTSICGVFCIDVHEASRPDATESNPGLDESMAVSQLGVIPWWDTDASLMNQGVAAAACEAAGKRLCTSSEWRVVCRGHDDTDYCYGDEYDPETCNGIDTYCYCDPYPHCYHDCGGDHHVMPTGSFAGCTNSFGIFDINGNVWEVVDAGDSADHYKGGAYNCSDSEKLHACDYDATWDPTAKGFRCCADGEAARRSSHPLSRR